MARMKRVFRVKKADVEELLAIYDLTGEGNISGELRAFCKTLDIGYDEAIVADMARKFQLLASKLTPKVDVQPGKK